VIVLLELLEPQVAVSVIVSAPDMLMLETRFPEEEVAGMNCGVPANGPETDPSE
jgi:hypothetical protein